MAPPRLGVRLGTDRNIFAGGHRHRPRHQTGNPGNQNAAATGFGSGHSDNQAGGGNNPIVGTQDCGPKPAYPVGAM